MSQFEIGRRRLVQTVSAGLLLPGLAPAVLASVKDRPQLTDGVQSGGLLGDRAMVWSRSDRPARMVVEWDTTSMFRNPRRLVSPLAGPSTKDFEPFWEFVAGPLNAGSFGPNPLDDTFGHEVVFQKAPPAQNTSPFAGYQFFGEVQIDAQSGEMTVQLRDLDSIVVFEKKLQPV